MKHILLLPALYAAPLLAQHSPYIEAVDEYVPAPGQFVNVMPEYEDGDDAQTMAAKCTEYLAQNRGYTITLGAWGGYVTFHFDHPIVNVAQAYDLYIKGNAIQGSSEAGIVMVSRDDNQNGKPDDAWYELAGSADTDSSNVVYDYAVTYTHPGEPGDVAWVDNAGRQGCVSHNNYHPQQYYPQWLPSSMTYSGTLLPANAQDISGNGSFWTLHALRQGYVDNLPNTDTIGNSFDIGWAVDAVTREPVQLETIDFVRVYTALNQQAGWLGETSTEVSGAMDLHPDASTADIASIGQDDVMRPSYDLWGRRTRGERNTGNTEGSKSGKNRKQITIQNHQIIIAL